MLRLGYCITADLPFIKYKTFVLDVNFHLSDKPANAMEKRISYLNRTAP